MSEPDPPPLLETTAHDTGMDRQLRANLRTLQDRTDSDTFRDTLDDVLGDRRSLREVARTPEWNQAVAPAAEQMMQQWARMSPAQRDALAAQGREELEAQRAQAHAERRPRDRD